MEVPAFDAWDSSLVTVEIDDAGRPSFVVTQDATESGLDQMRDVMQEEMSLRRFEIGQTAGAAISLSVGYVSWLLRGGVLLSSVLSSVPTWRFIDPLPVFSGAGRRREDEDDDESLEGIVQAGAGSAPQEASPTQNTTPANPETPSEPAADAGDNSNGSLT